MDVFIRMLLLFFVYAILGWCCEVAFAALKEGRFINRGFLNGPVCPIYGFGVIGVALALAPVKDDTLMLYLGSAALTTVIEFATCWAMEALFHARWWDYSDMPMNIMGYVCVPFSLIWGLACLIVVKWVHPIFEAGAAALPFGLCAALDGVFGAVFAFDLCATVAAVRSLSDRLSRLTRAAEELHAMSDELGQGIADTTQAAWGIVRDGAGAVQMRGMQAKERLEARQNRIAAWLEQRRGQAGISPLRRRFEAAKARVARALEEKDFGHRRLLSAFPTLKSHRYQEALETLRGFYERHRRRGGE